MLTVTSNECSLKENVDVYIHPPHTSPFYNAYLIKHRHIFAFLPSSAVPILQRMWLRDCVTYCDVFDLMLPLLGNGNLKNNSRYSLASKTQPDGCMVTKNVRPQQQDWRCFLLEQPDVIMVVSIGVI
jgi:hypothetical protein